MSDKQNKDSMDESSVNKILLDDEIQETQGSIIFSKESKDTKKKPKRLSTSSTLEASSGSPGKKKKPKIIHTPSDATGYVRIEEGAGTLKIDSKAVALENKKRREKEQVLEDTIVALRAQLAIYKNPGSQAAPSSPFDPSMSGELAGALSTSQYNDMLSYIGEQVKLYQDTQTASKLKKKLPSKAPSVDPKAPGPSNRIASINSGLAGKNRFTASFKRLRDSLRDAGDDLDINGSEDDHQEDILG